MEYTLTIKVENESPSNVKIIHSVSQEIAVHRASVFQTFHHSRWQTFFRIANSIFRQLHP